MPDPHLRLVAETVWVCRVCGCTEDDWDIKRTGRMRYWVTSTLCNVCAFVGHDPPPDEAA